MLSSTLTASGWAPFALEDSATVSLGGTVSILDSGALSVLDNDFDIELDPLTAILAKEPKHGDVTLNSDGTFEYEHDGKSDKKDDFKYLAFDGTGFSSETKVEIEIREGDPIPPEILGQNDIEVDEDSSRELKPDDLDVDDADSNFPKDFTIEVNDGTNYTHNSSVIFPVADFNGELVVPVRVYDGENFSNLFSMTVDVRPRNDAPVVIDTPPDQEAIEGVAITLPLAGYFDDIDVGDILRFGASGLPGSDGLTINPETGVLSGTPAQGDSRDAAYNVSVTATDSGGASASLSFSLVIFLNDRADLATYATIAVNPVAVGESARWQVDVLNKGPTDLDDGVLELDWSTSGPAMTVTAPPACTIKNNATSSPSASCIIDGLVTDSSLIFNFQGDQSEDGDNTLIAVAIADDPTPGDNSASAGSQFVEEFSEGPTQIVDSPGADIDSGDFNGDGHLDIVEVTGEALVFLNNGKRGLTIPGQAIAPGSGGSVVKVLDWNGDNALDIAVGGATDHVAEVFINNGSGGFSSAAMLTDRSIGEVRAIAAADLDLDGTDELIVAGSNYVAILRRSEQIGIDMIVLPVGAGIDVDTGDFDNDGFPDIVVVEASDRAIAVLVNTGDGSTFGRTRHRYGSVAHARAADINDDGLDDLLIAVDADNLTAPENIVLVRSSGGNFAFARSFGASTVSRLLAADVDGDGFKDIVAINEAGVHQSYRNDTAGNFILYEEQVVSAGMRSGILVDFNSDQSPDLLMVGSDALEIHANNGIGRLGLGDRIPPVISLIGEAVISIAVGTPYDEEGATATDDIDGDLNESIVTIGAVNTHVVGTYKITYNVTDRASNSSSTERTVKVGVNTGTGGSGGGAGGPAMLLGLVVLFAYRNRRKRGSAKLAQLSK